jgi:hypothetical protein
MPGFHTCHTHRPPTGDERGLLALLPPEAATDPLPDIIRRSLAARTPEGHLLWVGTRKHVTRGCPTAPSHIRRLIYEWFCGEIPPGAFITNKRSVCLEPLCIEPKHIEAITAAERSRRAGETKRDRERLIERFWASVTKHPSGCWTRTGSKSAGGKSGIDGETCDHRIAWVLLRGPIAPGRILLTKCGKPLGKCVNPEHYQEAPKDSLEERLAELLRRDPSGCLVSDAPRVRAEGKSVKVTHLLFERHFHRSARTGYFLFPNPDCGGHPNCVDPLHKIERPNGFPLTREGRELRQKRG